MIDMIVTLQVRRGMEEKAEGLLRLLEDETAENDPGCLRYQWYKAEEVGLYYLLQRWTTQAAIEAHSHAPHMVKLVPQIAECAVAKVITTKLTRLE